MNYQVSRKIDMKWTCRPATFLKRDSNTGVFLLNVSNFQEQ